MVLDCISQIFQISNLLTSISVSLTSELSNVRYN